MTVNLVVNQGVHLVHVPGEDDGAFVVGGWFEAGKEVRERLRRDGQGVGVVAPVTLLQTAQQFGTSGR